MSLFGVDLGRAYGPLFSDETAIPMFAPPQWTARGQETSVTQMSRNTGVSPSIASLVLMFLSLILGWS